MIRGTPKELIIRLLGIKDEDKIYELKEYRKHRSLSQNAYYYSLVTKIAYKLRRPTAEIHNSLLCDYGQLEVIDGSAVRTPLPDTEATEKRVAEMTTVHLKPTSQVAVGRDGVVYRTYVMMRGSHTYNSKEMTQLLNGCIQEAKQLDIETATPIELEQMRRDAEEAEARRKARQHAQAN